ncbi:hypothetical protein VTN00DRAFT_7165 [Thermoascus crustaceus]|uniref:uncharacterized protein n=1 Tax=Thermoascus crustaceus TaxID=5088 RepID=UPI0037421C06
MEQPSSSSRIGFRVQPFFCEGSFLVSHEGIFTTAVPYVSPCAISCNSIPLNHTASGIQLSESLCFSNLSSLILHCLFPIYLIVLRLSSQQTAHGSWT